MSNRDERIKAFVASGQAPQATGRAQVLRLRDGLGPDLILTDKQGRQTAHGDRFLALQAEHMATTEAGLAGAVNLGDNLDTWVRGTRKEGRSEVAFLRSGAKKIVRKWNTAEQQMVVTAAGKAYFANNREEWIIQIPVKQCFQLVGTIPL